LEDLLTRINAPLLCYLYVDFFMDLNFDLPQLHRLIGHAEEFKTFDRAQVWIYDDSIKLGLFPKTRAGENLKSLKLRIKCRALEWQLSSLAHVCCSSFPLISTLEDLEIWEHDRLPSSHWTGDMENAQWLELLGPFTALKNLHLTNKTALHVCGALLELSGERVTEVLPMLQNLFLCDRYPSKRSRKAITIFVAARRRSGHPVSVHRVSGNGRWRDITEALASGD